jgi:hypothetical protein
MSFGNIIAIISLTIGLIGIPSYLIGRRSRQTPDPRRAIDFDIILNPDDRLFDQDLKMTIGDHQIKCISRTRLAFWNQRDTVRGTDIVKSNPPRLEFAEGDAPLQVRVLSSSREEIKLAASIDPANPSSVEITFDFLDARDGAIFEIVHQGTKPPEWKGTIIGTKVRSLGSSKLKPDELAALARRPRLRRMPKGTIGLTGYVLGAVLSAIAFVWLAFIYKAPAGYLINPSHFNLNSMRGQANFANAVFSSGNSDANSSATGSLFIILGSLSIVLTGAAISTYRTFRRNRIPYDIAKLRA